VTVKLTIFKPTGKYYTEGKYETEKPHLFQIWDEVAQKVRDRKIPGLVDGSCWSDKPGEENWMVSVDVPDHPHNHPRIIRTLNPI
jgi:hypothetical protein